MRVFDREVNGYVAAGIFTIAVYAVAIVALALVPSLTLDRVTLFALTGGFLAFMVVYFVSMAVYYGIEE